MPLIRIWKLLDGHMPTMMLLLVEAWNVYSGQVNKTGKKKHVLSLKTCLLFDGRCPFLELAERKSSIAHRPVGPFQCLDTMVNKSHELAKRIAKLWSVTMFAILALMPTVCLGLHGED